MTAPTDDQIDELWDEIGCYFNLYPEVRNTVREALNRWGTLEPIALKDTIISIVSNWIPKELEQKSIDSYASGWNDCLTRLRMTLR